MSCSWQGRQIPLFASPLANELQEQKGQIRLQNAGP